VPLHWVVGSRRRGNGKNRKVCCSVYNVTKDQATAFSAGDYDEIVASGQRENAEDAIDGARSSALKGLGIRG
jgi:hypothetical protein